jgi:hypothetical protein
MNYRYKCPPIRDIFEKINRISVSILQPQNIIIEKKQLFSIPILGTYMLRSSGTHKEKATYKEHPFHTIAVYLLGNPVTI